MLQEQGKAHDCTGTTARTKILRQRGYSASEICCGRGGTEVEERVQEQEED